MDATLEVSALYGDDRARLGALRLEDGDRSLRERWAILQEKYPGIAEENGYVPLIIEHGWAVIGVPEDGVIYTIGLYYRFGQPELLLSTPILATDPSILGALRAVLNEIGERVREGLRVGAGDHVDVERLGASFHALADDDFDLYPCGYLARFEELFQDRFHERGGTLPVLWARLELAGAKKPAKPKAKAAAPIKKPRPSAARLKSKAPVKAKAAAKAAAIKAKPAPKKPKRATVAPKSASKRKPTAKAKAVAAKPRGPRSTTRPKARATKARRG